MITYSSGYKYQLRKSYSIQTCIKPNLPIDTEYISLKCSGELFIKAGYAWDGPSGPAIDTKDFMRGSLVHDAFYQLMREGHLDGTRHRADADKELRRICVEDGMPGARALLAYKAVSFFAATAASRKSNRGTLTAP